MGTDVTKIKYTYNFILKILNLYKKRIMTYLLDIYYTKVYIINKNLEIDIDSKENIKKKVLIYYRTGIR